MRCSYNSYQLDLHCMINIQEHKCSILDHQDCHINQKDRQTSKNFDWDNKQLHALSDNFGKLMNLYM